MMVLEWIKKKKKVAGDICKNDNLDFEQILSAQHNYNVDNNFKIIQPPERNNSLKAHLHKLQIMLYEEEETNNNIPYICEALAGTRVRYLGRAFLTL